ncbi:hypothetical protein BMS3Bbin14_00803 [bacterium BMS3Bbin14]|nr:hypothetical protein BMS3Bbin14_00803 [bacterium BMS3Bbin14]HDO31148.1 hypothetical protein [Desulfobacteraceae bacterium]
MKDCKDLCTMQEGITNQILEERNQEMAESIAEKRLEARIAEENYQQEIKAMEASGLKIANLEALDVELATRAEADVESLEAKMNEMSQEPVITTGELDIEKAFLPPDAFILTPSWSAEFSDDDAQDPLTGVSSISAQAVLAGGSCKDKYIWAKGGGSGIAGTGAGKIQAYVYFGFWFKPPVSRFYSIRPLFRFRGYYIVKANDRWYNSKYAKVTVSTWVNVRQYNWKGWNHVDVLNVADDNINVNRRFDTDRYMYTSYLLGGGDWAWISCVIGLYAYARGGGSYAKLDFATGNANKLCVPYCYAY